MSCLLSLANAILCLLTYMIWGNDDEGLKNG